VEIELALATGGYLSYIPARLLAMIGWRGRKKWTGAGLIGTLEGLVLLPLCPKRIWSALAVLAAAIAVSCWICGRAEKILGQHDDSRIILDEIFGYWTAMLSLPRTPLVLAAAFVLFRLFDTLKPPPCSWLERLPGGIGVMADDVGAGVMANVLLRLALSFYPMLLPS
jgi:phosphatidylglycerophosphatase A